MIEIVTSVFCIITTIVLGIVFLATGLTEKEKGGIILGLLLIVIDFVTTVENLSGNNQYIPAEPIAYNSTQTVFATNKGNIIVNGAYPDGVYMLNMDGDTVLVVWQAVEGEEVGLG